MAEHDESREYEELTYVDYSTAKKIFEIVSRPFQAVSDFVGSLATATGLETVRQQSQTPPEQEL